MRRRPKTISTEVLGPEERLPMPPALLEITPDSTLDEHIREDAALVHYALSRVYLAWNKAHELDDVCKLALTTTKLLQFRREVLNRQLGYLPATKNEGGIVSPLE